MLAACTFIHLRKRKATMAAFQVHKYLDFLTIIYAWSSYSTLNHKLLTAAQRIASVNSNENDGEENHPVE